MAYHGWGEWTWTRVSLTVGQKAFTTRATSLEPIAPNSQPVSPAISR